MYVPTHFKEENLSAILDLAKSHAFASLISSTATYPLTSFVPLMVEVIDTHTGNIKLLGHLAIANPHVEHLQHQADVTAIFHGPHAYVSPDWYDTAGVPTWNFANVIMQGKLTFIDEPTQKKNLVDNLTEIYERPRDTPWIPDYPEAMLDAIIGFEIQVEHIDGKFKLSQNKSKVDQQNVVDALSSLPDQSGQAVAKLMQKNLSK